MGLLDQLIGNKDLLGSAAKLVGDNPDIMNAAAALFSQEDSSVGGGGGLEGILSALRSSGLDTAVSSWLGSGANESI